MPGTAVPQQPAADHADDREPEDPWLAWSGCVGDGAQHRRCERDQQAAYACRVTPQFLALDRIGRDRVGEIRREHEGDDQRVERLLRPVEQHPAPDAAPAGSLLCFGHVPGPPWRVRQRAVRSVIRPDATESRATVMSPPSVSACRRSRVRRHVRHPIPATPPPDPGLGEGCERRDRDAAPRRADRVVGTRQRQAVIIVGRLDRARRFLYPADAERLADRDERFRRGAEVGFRQPGDERDVGDQLRRVQRRESLGELFGHPGGGERVETRTLLFPDEGRQHGVELRLEQLACLGQFGDLVSDRLRIVAVLQQPPGDRFQQPADDLVEVELKHAVNSGCRAHRSRCKGRSARSRRGRRRKRGRRPPPWLRSCPEAG